jgi:hypothetical protein
MLRSGGVVGDLLGVLPAIQFYDQPRLQAGEVREIAVIGTCRRNLQPAIFRLRTSDHS